MLEWNLLLLYLLTYSLITSFSSKILHNYSDDFTVIHVQPGTKDENTIVETQERQPEDCAEDPPLDTFESVAPSFRYTLHTVAIVQ